MSKAHLFHSLKKRDTSAALMGSSFSDYNRTSSVSQLNTTQTIEMYTDDDCSPGVSATSSCSVLARNVQCDDVCPVSVNTVVSVSDGRNRMSARAAQLNMTQEIKTYDECRSPPQCDVPSPHTDASSKRSAPTHHAQSTDVCPISMMSVSETDIMSASGQLNTTQTIETYDDGDACPSAEFHLPSPQASVISSQSSATFSVQSSTSDVNVTRKFPETAEAVSPENLVTGDRRETDSAGICSFRKPLTPPLKGISWP